MKFRETLAGLRDRSPSASFGGSRLILPRAARPTISVAYRLSSELYLCACGTAVFRSVHRPSTRDRGLHPPR